MDTALSLAIATCGTGSTVTAQAAASGGGTASLLPLSGLPLEALATAAGLLTIAGIGVAVLVALATRPRRTAPVLIPVDARLSPDGHYWWDGTAWRLRIPPA